MNAGRLFLRRLPPWLSVPPLLYALGVALAALASLVVFVFAMQPPPRDFWLMGLFLGGTALASVGVGYGAYRLGWLQHAPSLHWALLSSYVLASLLTFLNVWVIARLMFASQHDLHLATVLLFFAGLIAVSLGAMVSLTLTHRLRTLRDVAVRVAEGQFDVRVADDGRDEVAQLAQAFNHMAARLATAERARYEAETLRRNLLAWVGHDLRTPLASLRAILDALADDVVPDPAERARYLHIARRDVAGLAALVEDLFEMAQLDAGGVPLDMAWGSLADILSDTLESARLLGARRDIHVEGYATPDLDPVWMDALKVARVLQNIVANALRHTPPGGTVRITAERDGTLAVVSVCDTGEGIASDDLPHVFDQFYRGDPARRRSTGGAGLGLAIARAIVEAHGGTITIESTPGEGTCVTFTLPHTSQTHE
nr:HAMP domain-containing sensor histidine kinase [Ardenticatena sp.]